MRTTDSRHLLHFLHSFPENVLTACFMLLNWGIGGFEESSSSLPSWPCLGEHGFVVRGAADQFIMPHTTCSRCFLGCYFALCRGRRGLTPGESQGQKSPCRGEEKSGEGLMAAVCAAQNQNIMHANVWNPVAGLHCIIFFNGYWKAWDKPEK